MRARPPAGIPRSAADHRLKRRCFTGTLHRLPACLLRGAGVGRCARIRRSAGVAGGTRVRRAARIRGRAWVRRRARVLCGRRRGLDDRLTRITSCRGGMRGDGNAGQRDRRSQCHNGFAKGYTFLGEHRLDLVLMVWLSTLRNMGARPAVLKCRCRIVSIAGRYEFSAARHACDKGLLAAASIPHGGLVPPNVGRCREAPACRSSENVFPSR